MMRFFQPKKISSSTTTTTTTTTTSLSSSSSSFVPAANNNNKTCIYYSSSYATIMMMMLVVLLLLHVAISVAVATGIDSVVIDKNWHHQQPQRIIEPSSLSISSSTTTTTRFQKQQHHVRFLQGANGMGDITNDTTTVASTQTQCDAAFYNCAINSDACTKCYLMMEANDINWAGVTDNVPCRTVLQTLQSKQYCTEITDAVTTDIFCQTYEACIKPDKIFAKQVQQQQEQQQMIDCTKLTECNWPGFDPQYLGDGVCHGWGWENGGCYNSAACNYDGGDCCPDTCQSEPDAYMQCGVDTYQCYDPTSNDCDPRLAEAKCKINMYPNKVICNPSDTSSPTTLYRITMYDSYGDGWGSTTNITIWDSKDNNTPKKDIIVYSGSLEYGNMGVEYMCLSSQPKTCYNVQVSGNIIWGREVSWDIRGGNSPGVPSIALGGANMFCQFSIGGNNGGGNNNDAACANNCTGALPSSSSSTKKGANSFNDPNFVSLKDMSQCIDEKCFIQAAACNNDPACSYCFQDTVPQSCYSNDVFYNLIDCVTCKCNMKQKSTEFCKEQLFIQSNVNEGVIYEPYKCSSSDKMKGGVAVMEYTSSTNFTLLDLLLRQYDNFDHEFGILDKFVDCATAYHKQQQENKDHGDRTALGCLQILVNAMHPLESLVHDFVDGHNSSSNNNNNNDNNNNEDENNGNKYLFAIAEIATKLYTDGPGFCDCSARAYNNTSSCPNFASFKLLVRESLDACKALDHVDCGAWKEFATPCKARLTQQFTTIDFTKPDQCDYVHKTCGGSGPFPSFRRLDCENEVGSTAWSFYNDFATNCLKGNDNSNDSGTSSTKNNPVPSIPSDANMADKNNSPAITPPKKPEEEKKPYVPPEQRVKSEKTISNSYVAPENKNSSQTSSSSPWFRNIVLFMVMGYVGFFVYRRSKNAIPNAYIPYFGNRNINSNYYNNGDDPYTGLSLESTVTFEPVSYNQSLGAPFTTNNNHSPGHSNFII